MSTPTYERGDLVWHTFASREQLADDLADHLTASFNAAIDQRGQASVALSGGSTPLPLFKALADQSIGWPQVLATLVDERWVPPSHELSNQQFITTHLLNSLSDPLEFVPLFHGGDSAEADAEAAVAQFAALRKSGQGARRFDAVVLGMGLDGHTASFFPDAPNVGTLISYDDQQLVHTCLSPVSQVTRVTWSLAALLDTHHLVLHITGQDKRDLFERATEAPAVTVDEMMQWPIRAMAYQSRIPLHIYYAD